MTISTVVYEHRPRSCPGQAGSDCCHQSQAQQLHLGAHHVDDTHSDDGGSYCCCFDSCSSDICASCGCFYDSASYQCGVRRCGANNCSSYSSYSASFSSHAPWRPASRSQFMIISSQEASGLRIGCSQPLSIGLNCQNVTAIEIPLLTKLTCPCSCTTK